VRPDVDEDVFTDAVIELAMIQGWRVAHFRPAKTAKGYRTPMQGHVGWPDLALAKGGRFIAAELKSARGKPSNEQLDWLAALGDHGRLWRPSDIREIEETLR